MTILKDGKEYAVTEQKTAWLLSRKIGSLSVEYRISKELCPKEADLQAYVGKEELF